MPIEPVALDLAAYDHVTICAPIWVFALAAPVRSFCMQAAGRIREADYLLVHHTRGRYENAAREMDALLGLTHTGFRTLQCHTGHYPIKFTKFCSHISAICVILFPEP